jgi:tetratricopeptide (TPR) repeat protein
LRVGDKTLTARIPSAGCRTVGFRQCAVANASGKLREPPSRKPPMSLRHVLASLTVAALGTACLAAGPALAQTPDHAACGANFGRGYTADQQVAACTRLIDGGRLQPDDLAQAYQLRGKARAISGDNLGALPDYSEAIRLRPVYPEAFYNRGTALNELRRYDEAVADFTRAIAQRPGYANAHLNRGNAHIHSGRLPEAIADYEAAIRLDPNMREAWNNRGVAHRRLGNVSEADRDQAEARRLARSR